MVCIFLYYNNTIMCKCCSYICYTLISGYYVICCSLMGHSLCKEYYDEHMKIRQEYDEIATNTNPPPIEMINERDFVENTIELGNQKI